MVYLYRFSYNNYYIVNFLNDKKNVLHKQELKNNTEFEVLFKKIRNAMKNEKILNKFNSILKKAVHKLQF